jgi:hypothetical protein
MTQTATHRAALATITTRTAAAQYLAAVKGSALKALAAELYVTGTAAEMREGIAQRLVGSRLASAAIRSL